MDIKTWKARLDNVLLEFLAGGGVIVQDYLQNPVKTFYVGDLMGPAYLLGLLEDMVYIDNYDKTELNEAYACQALSLHKPNLNYAWLGLTEVMPASKLLDQVYQEKISDKFFWVKECSQQLSAKLKEDVL